MGLVKFGDYVKEVKINIDRNNNPYEYYVAGDHMDSEDLTIRRKGLFATDDVGPAFTRLFKPGQILYGSRRTYLKKVAVADFEGICSNTTFVLETKDENKLRQRLLPFIMLTDDFTKWSISKSKGSTNPYILFSDLANYEFELPDINKQDELVKLLWQAYATKESYREMIRATDEMVKSQFIEMFGDPITNSKECVVKKGYELFAFSSGKANTRANLNDSYKYDCYGGNGTTGKSKEYLIDYSTLVIGRVGEYCGSVHCTPTYSWITDNAIYIKEFNDKDLDINYLYYLFLFLDLHRFSAKTGQPKITQEALLGIDYICPGIEEQEKYVTFAHQADKSKFELKQAIEKIDKVMRALMQ